MLETTVVEAIYNTDNKKQPKAYSIEHESMMGEGYVYVMSNRAVPRIIQIVSTTHE